MQPPPAAHTLKLEAAAQSSTMPTVTPSHSASMSPFSASAHGTCDDAWVMWSMLHERDAAYAEALSAGPVLAQCTRFARPPAN